MKTLPYVIYHANCTDGFTAAWCAYRHFGEDGARYIPLAHGDPMPTLDEGAELFLVDFSFPRAALLALAAKHPQITILDHHISAAKELKDIEVEAANIRVVFDNDRSGACIAWDYFIGGQRPLPLLHVQDRDLWRFDLPNSREIVACLFSHEQDFSVWDSLMLERRIYGHMLAQGEALVRAEAKQVASLLEQVREGVLVLEEEGLIRFPAVNAPHFLASEVANALLQVYPDAPFAACYRDVATGDRFWSLRSSEGRMDVSKVATEFGGGGHRNAAGLSEGMPGILIYFNDAYQA